MKIIGYLSNHRGRDVVLAALQELAAYENYRIETVGDFSRVGSIAQAIWGLINISDVLVAYISKESPYLYYEIGLAHGSGKPVVILAEKSVAPPVEVLGQRVFTIDPLVESVENIAFRVQDAIEEAVRKKNLFIGYRNPRDSDYLPSPQGYLSPIGDFRALFSYEGAARGHRFERWFVEAAKSVPGWEVIESERNHRRDDGFDCVIWNSREDYELTVLGNPIAIELKSIRGMTADVLSKFLHRARISGLKAVVLATTGKNDARTLKLLSRLRKEEGINAIALDRDDLIHVSDSEGMVNLFKHKIRELLYGGEY
ncbi:hypothetical protein FXN63_01990 [Pigmentiphaga aceris]|uniref:Uncharacterized protein n=2 Tax=Pigmentiphaga aceris TaxID=1940612 RepID=A0A5C0B8A1_9BURK|nr:hypothetical protein FXN63_01990 [Pigmentiphaga aceris]